MGQDCRISSSIGHAHWTVELECDILFIMEGREAKDNYNAKELRLTELKKKKPEGWRWQEKNELKQGLLADSITRTAMSAVTDSPKKSKFKSAKEKKPQGKSQNERLKVVVRKLPPHLPEEIFWQTVSGWVSEETVFWKSFNAGKVRKR